MEGRFSPGGRRREHVGGNGIGPDAAGGSDEPGPERSGIVTRARDRVTLTWDRVLEARQKVPALGAAFDIGERDRDVAGGLLAGAGADAVAVPLVPVARAVGARGGHGRGVGGGRQQPVDR